MMDPSRLEIPSSVPEAAVPVGPGVGAGSPVGSWDQIPVEAIVYAVGFDFPHCRAATGCEWRLATTDKNLGAHCPGHMMRGECVSGMARHLTNRGDLSTPASSWRRNPQPHDGPHLHIIWPAKAAALSIAQAIPARDRGGDRKEQSPSAPRRTPSVGNRWTRREHRTWG